MLPRLGGGPPEPRAALPRRGGIRGKVRRPLVVSASHDRSAIRGLNPLDIPLDQRVDTPPSSRAGGNPRERAASRDFPPVRARHTRHSQQLGDHRPAKKTTSPGAMQGSVARGNRGRAAQYMHPGGGPPARELRGPLPCWGLARPNRCTHADRTVHGSAREGPVEGPSAEPLRKMHQLRMEPLVHCDSWGQSLPRRLAAEARIGAAGRRSRPVRRRATPSARRDQP